MKSELGKALEPKTKQEIIEKYGYALGAGRKALTDSYVAKFTSTGWVFANYKPIKVKVIKFFLYREVSEF